MGGVEIIEVPGSHHSILHDPYVQHLAAALNACWAGDPDTTVGDDEGEYTGRSEGDLLAEGV